jgi:hypothetical protein
MQILMDSPRAVNVSMGTVRTTSGIPIDPLQPVFCTMARNQILKIIGGGNALGFAGTKEIILNRIRIVSE